MVWFVLAFAFAGTEELPGGGAYGDYKGLLRAPAPLDPDLATEWAGHKTWAKAQLKRDEEEIDRIRADVRDPIHKGCAELGLRGGSATKCIEASYFRIDAAGELAACRGMEKDRWGTDCLGLIQDAKFAGSDTVSACRASFGDKKSLDCIEATAVWGVLPLEAEVTACKEVFGSHGKSLGCIQLAGPPAFRSADWIYACRDAMPSGKGIDKCMLLASEALIAEPSPLVRACAEAWPEESDRLKCLKIAGERGEDAEIFVSPCVAMFETPHEKWECTQRVARSALAPIDSLSSCADIEKTAERLKCVEGR